MWKLNIFLLLCISSFPGLSWSLKLRETVVPYYAVLGRQANLECTFDLEQDSLYTLKWYKDGYEFFRFKPQPKNKPESPITVFPLEGIFVNENRSSLHRVHLDPITFETAGSYRCEISADAPSFQTLAADGIMEIMVMPQKGPKISGIHPWYNVGDNFTANCTVSNSYPEAKLSWFINDVEINRDTCDCVESEISRSIFLNEDERWVHAYNSSSQLRFAVESNYFRDGALRVECRASFAKSDIALQDTVTTNIKTGLGFQFADLLSNGVICKPWLLPYAPVIVIALCVVVGH